MNLLSYVQLDDTRDWRHFGRTLFRLQDADPGYMLLRRARLDHATKLRYVLAWCTFYNPGAAAIASKYQRKAFYDKLVELYPKVKRGSERRHFRGQAGLKAIDQWRRIYPCPEDLVLATESDEYMGVRANMQGLAQFGEYFYWKLADIHDTVFDKRVDFTGCERYMPKVPQQGAETIGRMEGMWYPAPVKAVDNLREVMTLITKNLRAVPHPALDRVMKLQEAETVCCVFKQHVNGNYKYGFRSAKAHRSLKAAVGDSDNARILLNGLYAGGIWDKPTLDRIEEFL